MKNRLSIYPVLVLLLILSFGACKLVDPEERAVTFVHINPFSIKDSISTPSHASPSSAFVYFNNDPVGVFTLPANVPIQVEPAGGTLRILPGITRNGIKAYQSDYLLYYSHQTQLSYQPGQRIDITPTTGFRGNLTSANFLFEESFESSSQFVKFTGDTGLVRSSNPLHAFSGTSGGVFFLSKAQPKAEAISTVTIAKQPKEMYLELNYRNDVPFQVGIAVFDNANAYLITYIVTFKARSDWNKVYIPLNETINLKANAVKFSILFQTELDAAAESNFVAIDNIRVVAI